MEKDEPEVVHLEWERVEDPTRDPPPVLVVAEPEPAPKSNPVRDYLNQPNPIGQPGNEVATFVVLLVGAIAWAVAMMWVRGG